jgi:hypothetical protein
VKLTKIKVHGALSHVHVKVKNGYAKLQSGYNHELVISYKIILAIENRIFL